MASGGLTNAMLAINFCIPAFFWLTGLRPTNRPNTKPQTVMGNLVTTNSKMKRTKNAYQHKRWIEFSLKVHKRDGYKCVKCGRKKGDVVLQVHHKIYKNGLEIWDSPLSDCISLCNSCHAKEHGIIEPTSGWTLISIDDLGGLYGTCEKSGCGSEIRYEHLIYHPEWGYKTVGSTCVEYLTEEDRYISKEAIKTFKNIQKFIQRSIWEVDFTKNNNRFIYTSYSNHQIRIYGKENNYSFQIILKTKGEKWHEYGKFISAKKKSLEQVKELAYIVLKGKTTDNIEEKENLRHIYTQLL